MAEPTSGWVITGALAAAASAGFAGVQMWRARVDANRRAALDLLRELDQRVQEAWYTPTSTAQEEVLAYYGRKRDDLTLGARRYTALLNSLELLTYAIHKRLVDRKLVDDFVKTVVNEDVISLTFLDKFRKCCGRDDVYEHLYAYFVASQADARKASRAQEER